MLAALTDDEKALFCILTDPAGIDLAEFCIAGGQRVLTERGWIPIEDVHIGDLVLTHTGAWRPVTAVHSRGARETVVVKGQGHPGLIVTPNHQLLVRFARRGRLSVDGHRNQVWGDAEWRQVDRFGDLYQRKVYRRVWWAHASVVAPLPVPSWRLRQSRATIPPFSPTNVDWLWLYGLYLSEGNTFNGEAGTGVSWSVNLRTLPAVVGALERVGLRYNVTIGNNCSDDIARVSVYSVILVAWLDEVRAGHRAHEKQLAPWALGLDERQRRAVFDGVAAGDGWRAERDYIGFDSTSPDLAWGMKVLGASLGRTCSVSYTAEYDSSFGGKGRPYWGVMLDRGDHTNVKAFIEDGFVWSAVKDVSDGGVRHVYDLSVEEDHSFVVEGIVVHNCWVDEGAEDKCWRARPYQWFWWRNRDERQIDLCGRDLGKSLGTAMRTCSFPFRRPGGQRAIFAPAQNQLDLLTKVIEDRVAATWLTRQMLKGGRQAIIHSPRFEIVFLNRTQVVGCIPGIGGRGFKGVHAEELEIDEGQDLDEAAWKESFSTVKRHVKGWRFLIHGVTKGVQDTFYRLTLHKSGWTVHRRVAMHRETWTDEERKQFEEEFGGPESPDYKRNILGQHGDASSPLFPAAVLLSCCDDNELSDYNTKEYKRINITGEDVGPLQGDILQFLDYPIAHIGGKYQRFWAGMDIGRTVAPSEILVLGEYRKGKSDDTTLRILLRVHMTRVLEPDQADVIRWLIEQYKPTAFAMDSGGVGHPIYQELKTRQERAMLAAEAGGNTEEAAALRQVLDSIKGYDFGSKVPVGIMDPVTEDLDLVKADDEPNYVFRNVKEASTDMLRLLVSENRLEMPWDKDMIGQFQMATFSNNKTGVDEYGRTRRFSEGQDHVLDAARMVAMAYSNYKLEAMVKELLRAKNQKPQEVFISLVGGSGW